MTNTFESVVFSKKLKFENFIENIAVQVSSCEEYPADGMKESYTLTVKSNSDSGPNIHIYAEAEWGVIHALESVTQVCTRKMPHENQIFSLKLKSPLNHIIWSIFHLIPF